VNGIERIVRFSKVSAAGALQTMSRLQPVRRLWTLSATPARITEVGLVRRARLIRVSAIVGARLLRLAAKPGDLLGRQHVTHDEAAGRAGERVSLHRVQLDLLQPFDAPSSGSETAGKAAAVSMAAVPTRTSRRRMSFAFMNRRLRRNCGCLGSSRPIAGRQRHLAPALIRVARWWTVRSGMPWFEELSRRPGALRGYHNRQYKA
jgi:hypothetical protein